MNGGEKVTGEGREGATGHGFPIRKLLEKEEDEGNSPRAKSRPKKRSRRADRDGAMPESSELMATMK